MDVIKINISKLSTTEKKTKTSLEDYTEIDKNYLYFFKNTWIKYTDTQEMVVYSGGNLVSIQDGIVVLRNIQGKVMELVVSNYLFYCKSNCEQYKILQEILIEKEKLKIQREEFIKEKNKFLMEKKEFLRKYLS